MEQCPNCGDICTRGIRQGNIGYAGTRSWEFFENTRHRKRINPKSFFVRFFRLDLGLILSAN